jgi:hypothetical protein
LPSRNIAGQSRYTADWIILNGEIMKKLFYLGVLILSLACNGVTPRPTETIPTIPIPSKEAITFTPSITATITSTPTVVPLFFTEEFNADLNAWTFFQTGGKTIASTALENDTLHLNIPSPYTWYYGIHKSHTYQNVSVSAKFTGTPSGSMGLICRYSDSGWYEFNIASDRTYSVLFGQRLSDGIAQYTPIATAEGQYLQAGNLDYEIGLACQDNNLLLYINDKLFRKLDVAHYGLTEGNIGITASSFEEIPMTATFDWVKVNEVSQ